MPTARLVLAGALTCALALAAPARAAPTLQPLERCYVSASPTAREPVFLRAGGFTPNAIVDLTIDGRPVRGLRPIQADPTGAFAGSVPAPYRSRGEKRFTVTLAERDTPENLVSATSRVTALSVQVTPRQAAPSRRVVFSGRGFTGTGPVFAHYVLDDELHATVRMGRPRGHCGTFGARRLQFPFRRPETGSWVIQFDHRPTFTPAPRGEVFFQLEIQVFRNFEPAR
jgi:hypothetical protein